MKSVIFILVTASALCCRAQQSKTDPTMVKFFAGNWSCTGEFARRKKIEADVSFTPELDGNRVAGRDCSRPAL